ncbi:hypothetical protein AB4305_30190 [Nocardia sp. 2YAB30]|uniref:hypothetical protein n=1 Tax=Nocardia sp. 2YAB30 TaxID=3233022 RepID=UPI003F99D631
MQNRPRIQRKPAETRLWVMMPYDPTKPPNYNRSWMQSVLGGRKDLVWNKPMKRWEVARTHLWTLARAMADRFGEAEVMLEFNTTERCSDSCRRATIPVYECVCSCLGRYHGGRGAERNWIPVGPHRLISKDDPKLVHFVVCRGDMPAPEAPAGESALVPPRPSAPTAPPSVQPVVQSPPPTAPRSQPPTSVPLPATTRAELPPGCGPAMFVFVVAVFSLLALGISPWFWIGTALLLLGALVMFAEQHGL